MTNRHTDESKLVSIPEARAILRRLAINLDQPVLADLASRMYRAPLKYPRAKPTRGSLYPKLARNIREYKALHPGMTNRDIGRKFDVDGARVSEAIHGRDSNGKTV